MPRAEPIGIYDSGLGGLSVVREIQRSLPHESLLYLADTARVPYGGRAASEIFGFSLEILEHLVQQGVKLILCACNTSSVLILPRYQFYQGVPVLGLAQAGALLAQPYQRLALLATEATIRSGGYARLVQQAFPETELIPWACPDFVPLVESGDWSSPAALDVVAQQLAPLQSQSLDAVLLGCSHYPYLEHLIQSVLGDMPLLDPATALARQTVRYLSQHALMAPASPPQYRFQTTGNPQFFAPLAKRYLGRELQVEAVSEGPASVLSA